MNTSAGKIRTAVTVFGLALSLYWMVTYSGLYRYLAEYQLDRFGAYYSKINMLILCGIFALVGEVVRIVLRGAERPVPTVAGVGSAASTPALAAKVPFDFLAYKPFLGFGIVFAIGAYFLMIGMNAGSLHQLQVADFANSSMPSHTIYAEVRGYPDSSYLAQNNYVYLPMREHPDPASPVQMVVGVDETRMGTELTRQDDGSVLVRGMLEPQLENEIRYGFQKNNMTLANPCWILRTNRNPGSDETIGVILILISIGLGGFWKWRDSRRPAARPLP